VHDLADLHHPRATGQAARAMQRVGELLKEIKPWTLRRAAVSAFRTFF
jgi:hypothetical protein